MRWLASTIELNLGLEAFFRSGTFRSVSKLPIWPVWFSRTTNFR